MKKNDFILIIIILAITGLVCCFSMITRKNATTEGAKVVVTIDGREYGVYPLNEDMSETIELKDGTSNTLVIKDGYADITQATCPDQICVNHIHIHYDGETIVCLPNKLVIEIVDGTENEVDGVTH